MCLVIGQVYSLYVFLQLMKVAKHTYFQYPNLKEALENLVGLEKTFSPVQWVQEPLENVFDFFSNEGNLDTITPDSLGFKVLKKNTPEITGRLGFAYTRGLDVGGVLCRIKGRRVNVLRVAVLQQNKGPQRAALRHRRGRLAHIMTAL